MEGSTVEQPIKTVEDGIQKWLLPNGALHREDGPAVIRPDGYRVWYQDGKLHREDGPARIYPNGNKSWWLNGKRHREDGPAVIYSSGYQAWYRHGKIHREDGPAIIYPDGTKEYHIKGTLLEEGTMVYRVLKEKERRRNGGTKWLKGNSNH